MNNSDIQTSKVQSSVGSPTRVVDFETMQDEESHHSTDKLMTPPRRSSNQSQSQSQPGTPNSVLLPPLEESASASASFDHACDGSMDRTSENVVAEQNPQEDVDFLNESFSMKHETEVEELQMTATTLAARGKEEDAIKAYHQALRLTRADMMALKKIMKASRYRDASFKRELRNMWIKMASLLAEIRTTMAILYERLGEYGKAIKACEEAREVYNSFSHFDPKSHEEAVKEMLGRGEQMEHMIGRLSSARDSFDQRRELHSEAIQSRVRALQAKTENSKEELYIHVFGCLNKALRMERESLGETHPQVADTVSIYAKIYMERGESDLAVQQMESSVDILRLSLGRFHPRAAMAARELARMFEARKRDVTDISKAVFFYAEALEGFKESYGIEHRLVGETLNNIAVLHIQSGEYDFAVQMLSDALTSFEAATENRKAINAEVVQVWKNLGECYARRRQWENAHFAYTSALEVQRDARRPPEAARGGMPKACDDTSLGDTLLRLGKATKETLRYDDAHMIYNEALVIYRGNYRAAKTAVGSRASEFLPDAQDRLAHTMYCMGEIQELRGKYTSASKMYSDAFHLRLNSDAQRQQSRLNMVHCAMALVGIGNVHIRQGEVLDACMVYRESLSYLDGHGVPEDHEIVKMIKSRLSKAEGGILANLSWSDDSAENADGDYTLAMDARSQEYLEEEDFDSAIDTLMTALEIRRRRLTKRQKRDDSRYMEERADVARTLGDFARILVKKGDTKQAAMLYKEAIRTYQYNGAADDHPCIHDLSVELEQLLL